MKLFFAALPIQLSIALLMLSGCSGDPNAVGIGVLPAGDSLQVTALASASTSDVSFLSRVAGSSSILLVGQSNDIEARTLLKFSGLSTIPSTAAIDSASLQLTIGYRFKDSAGTLAFEVHNLLRTFPQGKFLWDSAMAPGTYSDTIVGRIIRDISPQDTTIRVRIDTTFIKQWRSTDVGSVILIPGGTIIAGASNVVTTAADLRPALSVSYHDTSAQSMTLRSAAALFVADGIIPAPADRIVLQAGVTNKAILHFDSLTIPLKASITQAILEVALDSTLSLTNGFTRDNIDAFLERRSSAPYDSVITYGTPLGPVYVNGQKIYRANIKSIVQQWFLHEPNNGILLRATGELTTLDRFVLYGTSAPAALRPKLTITYTLLP